MTAAPKSVSGVGVDVWLSGAELLGIRERLRASLTKHHDDGFTLRDGMLLLAQLESVQKVNGALDRRCLQTFAALQEREATLVAATRQLSRASAILRNAQRGSRLCIACGKKPTAHASGCRLNGWLVTHEKWSKKMKAK